ncbi:hypothetical protein KI387_019292, partial [Taxus chinensis]
VANDMVTMKKQLSKITMWNAPRKPDPLNRPRVTLPPHRISLEATLVNATCDTDEPKEEEEDGDGDYLEVKEVDDETQNGLIKYVEGEEDEDDEEA